MTHFVALPRRQCRQSMDVSGSSVFLPVLEVALQAAWSICEPLLWLPSRNSRGMSRNNFLLPGKGNNPPVYLTPESFQQVPAPSVGGIHPQLSFCGIDQLFSLPVYGYQPPLFPALEEEVAVALAHNLSHWCHVTWRKACVALLHTNLGCQKSAPSPHPSSSVPSGSEGLVINTRSASDG